MKIFRHTVDTLKIVIKCDESKRFIDFCTTDVTTHERQYYMRVWKFAIAELCPLFSDDFDDFCDILSDPPVDAIFDTKEDKASLKWEYNVAKKRKNFIIVQSRLYTNTKPIESTSSKEEDDPKVENRLRALEDQMQITIKKLEEYELFKLSMISSNHIRYFNLMTGKYDDRAHTFYKNVAEDLIYVKYGQSSRNRHGGVSSTSQYIIDLVVSLFTNKFHPICTITYLPIVEAILESKDFLQQNKLLTVTYETKKNAALYASIIKNLDPKGECICGQGHIQGHLSQEKMIKLTTGILDLIDEMPIS